VSREICWRLHLPVPPSRVFATIDSADGRARFWAESAEEHDGVIRFRFINGATYDSRVVERRIPSLFAIDYFGAQARFELTDDGRGGTDLVLTHAGVSDDEWLETHAGWLNVLLLLKAWLVTGIDLRNHDPHRTWDQRYVDQ
jgi:hypothetical protein